MRFIYGNTGVSYLTQEAAVQAMLEHEPWLLDDELPNAVQQGIYEE